MAVRNRVRDPTQCGTSVMTTRCTKGGRKLDVGWRMPGAGLSRQEGAASTARTWKLGHRAEQIRKESRT